MRHLVIVSRNHPELYIDLVERFREDRNVEVIVDRRVARRNTLRATRAHERGTRERRRSVSKHDDLAFRSHYVVTI